MLVGVVTTSYPRHAGDFAGTFVRERVRALVAGGATVEVIAAGRSDAGSEPGVTVSRVPGDLFEGAGAPEALDAGGARALVAGAAFSARLAAAVRARIGRWAAVESHWLAPCALAVAAAGARDHRAFAHGGDVALLERLPGGDALARVLARSGATFTFASEDLRRRFQRLCGCAVPATIAAAPFDETLFRPRSAAVRARLRDELGCRGAVVLGVGRLVPVKGWDLLVRAVARLPRSRRPVLVLAGAGPEGAMLVARAAGRVELRLLGALDRRAVADWMAAADLYVQPSRALPGGRTEGTPLAVREALAAGLPVVAAATGGLAELRHPRLQLVTPADPSALAGAIDRVLLVLHGAGTAKESTQLPLGNCASNEAHTPLQCG
jgi:glycosyltransferase involved in cell wall biosynthesis